MVHGGLAIPSAKTTSDLTTLTTTPLALAFLAGFSIELLFALLDRVLGAVNPSNPQAQQGATQQQGAAQQQQPQGAARQPQPQDVAQPQGAAPQEPQDGAQQQPQNAPAQQEPQDPADRQPRS